MSASRIVFVNRFFHPDHSATSQLLSDLAFHLSEQGWSVRVVTSRLRYEDPSVQLDSGEWIGGVSVRRVWTSRLGRARLLHRAVDCMTFYVTATWRLWRETRRGDVVVTKTDPPLFGWLAAVVCGLKGARLVHWVQDVFPEIASAYGLRVAKGPLGLCIRAMRNWAYKRAAVCCVLGEGMAAHLRGEGIPAERLRCLPNWSDGRGVYPVELSNNRLVEDWGLGDRFVVGYSGNLGRGHDAGTLLAAARNLSDREAVAFLLVGGGANRPWLESEADRSGLSNMVFQPYQAREKLAESLSAADVHLVSLRSDMEGLMFPSKLFGVLAAGRPVIFIGDTEGEIAELLQEYDCGLAVAEGDSEALAEAIRELERSPERVAAMGRRARQLFEARFDREIALAGWEEALLEVAGKPSPATVTTEVAKQ